MQGQNLHEITNYLLASISIFDLPMKPWQLLHFTLPFRSFLSHFKLTANVLGSNPGIVDTLVAHALFSFLRRCIFFAFLRPAGLFRSPVPTSFLYKVKINLKHLPTSGFVSTRQPSHKSKLVRILYYSFIWYEFSAALGK